jgi:hypothetical protein
VSSLASVHPTRAPIPYHGPPPPERVAAKLQAGASNSSKQVWDCPPAPGASRRLLAKLTRCSSPVQPCSNAWPPLSTAPLLRLPRFHPCAHARAGPGLYWTDRTDRAGRRDRRRSLLATPLGACSRRHRTWLDQVGFTLHIQQRSSRPDNQCKLLVPLDLPPVPMKDVHEAELLEYVYGSADGQIDTPNTVLIK